MNPPLHQKRRKNLNGDWCFIRMEIKLEVNQKKGKADYLKRKTNIL